MKKTWTVYYRIIGEFHCKDTFSTEAEARALETKLICQGIWDEIEVCQNK